MSRLVDQIIDTFKAGCVFVDTVINTYDCFVHFDWFVWVGLCVGEEEFGWFVF